MKHAFNEMNLNARYSHMLWLVEASYADWAFHLVNSYEKVLVLTLKDNAESNRFVHLFDVKDKTKSGRYLESVWEINWVSLLPLAAHRSIRYLAQTAFSGVLQTPEVLLRPGVWGDSQLLNASLSLFFPTSSSRYEEDV